MAIGVAVALLALLFFYFIRPDEPSYHGRALSEWLLPITAYHQLKLIKDPNLSRVVLHQKMKRERADAEEAMYAIGTNAIPTLLNLLRAEDSPLRIKLQELIERQSYIHVRYISAQEKHFMAERGFFLLTNQAKSAVPDLLKMGNDPNYNDPDMIYFCLCDIDSKETNKMDPKRRPGIVVKSFTMK